MNHTDILIAIVKLNNNYGRGEIVSINTNNNTYVRKPFQCKPETRRFKIKGRTVYACGHQHTIKG